MIAIMTTNTVPHQLPLDSEVQKFLKNLLDPEMYGWAVTEEVRNEARRLLGIHTQHER